MPKRLTLQTVFVHRDGKLTRPEIGKVFDYTAEELKDIKDNNPDAVRVPTDESDKESDGLEVKQSAAQKKATEDEAAKAKDKADKTAEKSADKTVAKTGSKSAADL